MNLSLRLFWPSCGALRLGVKLIFYLVLVLGLFLGVATVAGFAQTHRLGCGAELLREKHRAANPAGAAALDSVILSFNPSPNLQKTSQEDGSSRYVIPVVVHVIHSGRGARDSISMVQVRRMFSFLYYQSRAIPGTIGFGKGSDTQLEFSLATRDPNGNPHSGVNYIKSDKTNHHINDAWGLKSLIQWDPTKYCNIWLVNEIKSEGTRFPQLAGYAVFPDDPNPELDGIVMLSSHWGNSSAAKSTAIHELGHWVSLFHPFQGGCDGLACQNEGDRVCDTPPVVDADFKNINERLNSCNSDVPDRADLTRNYMDYVTLDEACNLFTAGQVARLTNVMDNARLTRRYNLYQTSNLEATGAGPYSTPEAIFWAEKLRGCPGSSFRFKNYSRGVPHEFEWIFPGGRPATSTERNPVVSYDSAGSFAVTLRVRNLSGVWDTLTRQDFITVVDTVLDMPFTETFNRQRFPRIWYIENEDVHKPAGAVTWEIYRLAGHRTPGSAVMRHYNYNDYNQRDGLQLPEIRTTNAEHVSLAFSWAYAPLQHRIDRQNLRSFSRLYTDTLRVWVSENCGETWDLVFMRGGLHLSTFRQRFTSTNPSGEGGEITNPAPLTEWLRDTINLDKYKGKQRLTIKFQSQNGFSNNLFIDDVEVAAYEAKVKKHVFGVNRSAELLASEVSIYPSPFSQTLNIKIDQPKGMGYAVVMVNSLGQVVHRQRIYNPITAIPLTDLPTGVYLVTINDPETGQTYFSKKILRQ